MGRGKSMVQRTIFEAERRKIEGMELSYKNSDPIWREAVISRMNELIATKETFNADDVLEPIEERGIFTKTNSALGSIFTAFKRTGQIEATDNFKSSRRASRHRAPLRQWRVV